MATAEEIKRVRLNIDDLQPEVNNLIDRGDCENEIPPAIAPENSIYLLNAIWQRDSARKYKGNYSYKFTKTDVASYVGLTDNALSNDLHGLTPGQKYTFASRLYIPSGGIQASNIILRWRYFDGGSLFYDIKASELYDDWQYIYSVFQIPDNTTGVNMRYQALGSVLSDFWVDEIEIYEGDPVFTFATQNDFSDQIISDYIDMEDSVNYASWKLINLLIVRLRKEILKDDRTGSEATEFHDLDKRMELLEAISKKYKEAYNAEIGNATGKYYAAQTPIVAGGML